MTLDRKKIIYASLVFGWISIFWNVYDQLIQSINTYAFTLSPDKSGYILAIDNILGLLLLPLFGHMSDKCKSVYGKRTPYIIVGTIISLIGFLFVGLFASQRKLIPYIISLCLTLIAMASYRSAGLSLVPDIVFEPERSRANSINQLVSVIFTLFSIILALIFMPLKYARASNFMPIVLAVIILSIITFIVFLFKFNEPEEIAEYNARLERFKADYPEEYRIQSSTHNIVTKQDARINTVDKFLVLASLFFFYIAFNALVSNFTVYSDVVLHFNTPQLPLVVIVVGALPGFIFAIKVSNKIGRKYTIVVGYLMMFSALLLANLLTAPAIIIRILLLLCFLIAGMGFGFAMVNMYPFYLELSKDKNVGQNTGIFASVMTASMVITPILAGKIITAVGKKNNSVYYIKQVIDGNEVIVEKIGDYTVLLPYAATALIIATICALLIRTKIKHTNDNKKGIELFDVDM